VDLQSKLLKDESAHSPFLASAPVLVSSKTAKQMVQLEASSTSSRRMEILLPNVLLCLIMLCGRMSPSTRKRCLAQQRRTWVSRLLKSVTSYLYISLESYCHRKKQAKKQKPIYCTSPSHPRRSEMISNYRNAMVQLAAEIIVCKNSATDIMTQEVKKKSLPYREPGQEK
jgi:hypothetical protein